MAVQLLDFVFCGFRALGVRDVCCGVLFRGLSFLRVLRWFCTGWSGNFLQSVKSFSDAVVRASGVQCGLSRGEVCFGSISAESSDRLLVMRCFCCVLLSRCVVLWRVSKVVFSTGFALVLYRLEWEFFAKRKFVFGCRCSVWGNAKRGRKRCGASRHGCWSRWVLRDSSSHGSRDKAQSSGYHQRTPLRTTGPVVERPCRRKLQEDTVSPFRAIRRLPRLANL